MTFSWSVFLVVLLLGVLQLTVGVVLGRYLSTRSTQSAAPKYGDVRRLRHFARRLFDLVSTVAEDVDQHQVRIKQVNRELASVQAGEKGGLTEFVLKTIGQIMQTNEQMHTRLNETEEKLQQQSEQIESQLAEARTDPLTGLPNRRVFKDELRRRIAEWQRKGTAFCMAMIDIDHFKKLNDRYGHPEGDKVLRDVAEVLSNTLREMDLICRIGGEEFAAVLPGTNLVEGRRATERIREAVASHEFTVEELQLQVTVSLGLAAVTTGDNPGSLVKRADEALYTSKRAGRNCGYFRDGKACVRIGGPAQPAAVEENGAADDDAPDAVELAAICNDLRCRLEEVATEAGPPQVDDDMRR